MRNMLSIWTLATLAQLACLGQESAKLPTPFPATAPASSSGSLEGTGPLDDSQTSEQLSNAPGPARDLSDWKLVKHGSIRETE